MSPNHVMLHKGRSVPGWFQQIPVFPRWQPGAIARPCLARGMDRAATDAKPDDCRSAASSGGRHGKAHSVIAPRASDLAAGRYELFRRHRSPRVSHNAAGNKPSTTSLNATAVGACRRLGPKQNWLVDGASGGSIRRQTHLLRRRKVTSAKCHLNGGS